jgi:hypothetical protein
LICAVRRVLISMANHGMKLAAIRGRVGDVVRTGSNLAQVDSECGPDGKPWLKRPMDVIRVAPASRDGFRGCVKTTHPQTHTWVNRGKRWPQTGSAPPGTRRALDQGAKKASLHNVVKREPAAKRAGAYGDAAALISGSESAI